MFISEVFTTDKALTSHKELAQRWNAVSSFLLVQASNATQLISGHLILCLKPVLINLLQSCDWKQYHGYEHTHLHTQMSIDLQANKNEGIILGWSLSCVQFLLLDSAWLCIKSPNSILNAQHKARNTAGSQYIPRSLSRNLAEMFTSKKVITEEQLPRIPLEDPTQAYYISCSVADCTFN